MNADKGSEELRRKRLDRVTRGIQGFKAELGKRLDSTREIFDRRVCAVDPHTHSCHSDGSGTIEENLAAVRNARLDFVFATDHWGIDQRADVAEAPYASWGQEPVAGPHHIGLLCNETVFKPRREDIADDFATARSLARFAWIPHPAGWYPDVRYTDEAIDTLWTLGGRFAMEVINGAAKVVRAFDQFDRRAIDAWDRLLNDGRRVAPIGSSDAHCPEDIGSAWTGVFAKRRTAPSILKALNAGACFASEAALVEVTCDGEPMGSTITRRRGAEIEIRIRAADAAGLALVTAIVDGRVARAWRPDRAPLFDTAWSRRIGSRPGWIRIETISADDRRAFSAPIYLAPKGRG